MKTNILLLYNNSNFVMINLKVRKIWQKLKELTEEQDKKEVILNLVVKDEKELNDLEK
ncbi:MAG: hypothetical protein J6P12_00775 [Methanobrevibacter sp.]|nr:hypothetical protein [Methanobrevibacter sp.]